MLRFWFASIKLQICSEFKYKAKYIYLAHNHPSKNVQPSREDVDITNKIVEYCSSFDIDFGDHFIVTAKEVYSMRDNNLLIHPKTMNLSICDSKAEQTEE